MGWGLIIALFLSVIILFVLFRLLHRIVPLILNGMFGVIVFWLFGLFGVMNVPLDIWTFLIASFGGIFGVAIVLAFTWIGVPL
ncbi:Uncharacterised protein [uncultured archaeon]|nr:Uncharacterised protein [uncultured archaeon]